MLLKLLKRFTLNVALVICIITTATLTQVTARAEEGGSIKWFAFNCTDSAMTAALDCYLAAKQESLALDWDWISLLAYIGAKNVGNFKKYAVTEIKNLAARLISGVSLADAAKEQPRFSFFDKAYRAVLGGLVGEYTVQEKGGDGKPVWKQKFGLKGFSPIADGYSYSHSDDFGNARSFGGRREHLGHDLMAGVGTPVVAVESGVVETLGWNYFGGWRIGIRSNDGLRYYYYAHLRKDKPYVNGLGQGHAVKAGDVIGYVGQTGYSSRENYNGVRPAHLHIGVQLIFEETRRDNGYELWIDLYELTKFLRKNKSAVAKDGFTGDYRRVYDFFEPDTLQ